MCENARKCDYCHKPSSDFVLANITASEKRIAIWLCYECYQKLFKNKANGEK